jgi:hypothetical protein
MADEGANPFGSDNASDISNPAGNQAGMPAPKKRRRRRPRRRKKKNVAPDIKVEGLNTEEQIIPPPPPPPQEEEVFSAEPETIETAHEEPVSTELPQEEVSATEEKIFTQEEQLPPEPQAEEPIQPEVAPPPPLTPEDANKPIGWDSLKQAIKEDHEITKQQLEKGAIGVAAGAAVAAAVSEPEKKTESKPVIKEIPKINPEEDEERKEIIRIISKYAVGGCAVFAILGGLFFFNLPQRAFDAVKNFFVGAPASQQQQTQEGEVVIPKEVTGVTEGVESSILAGENRATSKEQLEQGTETAILTGEDVPKERISTSAVSTAMMIGKKGEQELQQDRIASYMNVLTRLQNAFKTDIDELLSKADDREVVLEKHIKELEDVLQEAIETQNLINERKDEIKVEYNQVSTLKDQYEKDFFNAMDKLEGTEANSILIEFIDASKRYTALKAEYSALDKTSKLFDTAVKNMDARIKDIEYNRSALIKGVKVVDIKGSDLNLIIDETEL